MKIIDNLKKTKKGYYYYQTKDFATVKSRFAFYFENTQKNILTADILCAYLFKTNAKYKTKKSIMKRTQELYSTEIYGSVNFVGKSSLISFGMSLPSPNIIEANFFSDAVEFFKDMLLNPNFKDGKLKKSVLNEIKKDMINSTMNNIKNPAFMQEKIFEKNAYPKSDILYRSILDINDLKEKLNSIKDEDIINMYHNILNHFVGGYIFGDLTLDQINEIDKAFTFKEGSFDYKYAQKDYLNEGEMEVTDKNTSQSYLYEVYDLNDYNPKKYYLYNTISAMLNNSMGPLNEILRTKLGLVYSYRGAIFSNRGMLEFYLPIDSKNKEEAIKGIDMVLDEMQNKEKVSKLLKLIKEREKETYYTCEENINDNISELQNYILKFNDRYSVELRKIESIKTEDIINEIKGLKRKYIFFYKGEKNEK